MTPEHLSELQNILAFLRENDLKQSEASLIVEVQGLMEAAERERDRATRRDQGNNDDDADDPSEGAEAHPSSPSRALGRFGSNIEQTFAAMGEDLDARESDDDGSSVDTFATPAGDFASRVAASVEDDDDERDVARDSDGDISAAAFAHARDDVPPRAVSLAAAIDALAVEDDDDERDVARDSDDDVSAAAFAHAHDADVSFAAEVPAANPGPARLRPFSASSSCVGSMNPDEFHALANEWQTRPLEEYDEDEDPGYAREVVPPEDHDDFARREVDEWREGEAAWDTPRPSEVDEWREGEAARDAPRPSLTVTRETETETETETDASRARPVAVAPRKTEAPPDFFARAMERDLTVPFPTDGETRGETCDDAGEGFAFDKSPVGSATPASETNAPALGWGGSEFGGSSHATSPHPGATGNATPRSPAREELADLDSAADALRAWAASERRDERDEPESPKSITPSAVDRSAESVGTTNREEDEAEDEAGDAAGDEVGAESSRDGEEAYDAFTLRVIHRARRTGFEEHKDFPARIGSIVAGRYEIVEHLGSAAFSKAVEARDLQTGMSVCLKIVKNSKDFFDQSLDEVKLLKLVNERDPGDAKGILRLYDYFYHAEHLFIVTELLRANLYEFQKFNIESEDETYFTLPAIKSVARQVLTSLAFMHSLDLIHCDLKPENILVKSYSKCEVKVIDLGSSCYVTDHLSSYVQSRSYRAPEVILGAPYDTKVDVWSLGCILAELYTGEVLFHNDSLASLLAKCAGVLGPFDPALLRQGKHARDFFTKSGRVYERDEVAGTVSVLRPKRTSLAARLGLSGEGGEGEDGRSNPAADDASGFVDFLLALLRPNPLERLTAEEALTHPWLASEDRRATREGDAKERALASQL